MQNTDPVVDGLVKVLADSYALLVKTHNYHWNVEGPNFASLHTLFEEQYTDLQGAVDEIAERIRALGAYAPGGLKAFAETSSIADAPGDRKPARDMIADLLDGQKTLAKDAAATLKTAEEAGDEVTVDLMIERITVHDKNAWMLQAHLA